MLKEGHYEGNLTRLLKSSLTTTAVGIDITFTSDGLGRATISDRKENYLDRIRFWAQSSSTIHIWIPSLQPESFELRKSGDTFTHSSTYRIEFSQNERSFFLKIYDTKSNPIYFLSGRSFNKDEKFEIEPPRVLTLSEAINRALDWNFESKMEFEHLVQSRSLAFAAQLRFFPSISLVSVATGQALPKFINPGAVLMGAVGDFVSYLLPLPSRWHSYKAASAEAHAQEASLALMRADLANQVEGLCYILDRDRDNHSYLKQLVNRLKTLPSKLESLEKAGKAPAATTRQFNTLLKSLTLAVEQSEATLLEGRRAISEALSFHSAEAVADILFDQEAKNASTFLPIPALSTEKSLTGQELAETALARSFEVTQMEYLIEAADHESELPYFSFLDPQGDPQWALTPGLYPNLQIERSKRRVLATRLEQVKTRLTHKAQEAVAALDGAIRTYGLARELWTGVDQSLSESLGKLDAAVPDLDPGQAGQGPQATLGLDSTGSPSSTLDEIGVLEAKIQGAIETFNKAQAILAAYRIAKSKIDRMSLEGRYGPLLPKLLSMARLPLI